MEVHVLPVLQDNYGFVLRCPQTEVVALVDTPDADALIAFLDERNWRADIILNTHHHWDHAGGNTKIIERYGCEVVCSHHDEKRIDGVTRLVREDDVVNVGEVELKVFDVPGHTLGHIAYYDECGHALFCGDTIFVGGCGRLFEGSPQQMQAALAKIKALPDDTKIYCAHEYTLSNYRFAQTIETKNSDLNQALMQAEQSRQNNRPTVPSTVGWEKKTNPFLRWDVSEVIAAVVDQKNLKKTDAVSVFAALRELKDEF